MPHLLPVWLLNYFWPVTEYFRIGKLVATHGVKGELLLLHHLGKKTSLKGIRAIFIEERKEAFIPWFVESGRIKTETESFLKLEGVDTKEQAVRLTQKEVWLPEPDFKKLSAKAAPINFLGYDIVEGEKLLGRIEEIIEQPHQILCKVLMNDKEVLIPLHEETIKKVDRKKRLIIVDLPEGLLEIYQ
jgi:16S rRNA processing protein RimM